MIRSGLFLVLLFLFWSSIVIIAALGSLPYNPLSPSHVEKLNILSVIPEGWAFFTRSPRETNYYIYKENGQGWDLYSYKNASYKNAFGLIRNTRGQGVELSLLLEKLKEDAWAACMGPLPDCMQLQALPEIKVLNASAVRSLCGVFLIEKKEPIPWAWSKSSGRIHMPSKIIKLNVVCP